MRRFLGKITIFIFLALIVGSFWYWENVVQGQETEEKLVPEQTLKVLPKRVDGDKNKIFDELEVIMKDQPDEAFFDTIILFEENLSDTLFEKVRGKIGDFSLKYQYPSISGIAATLTKGQIIALSKVPFVKQIEDDAKMEIFLDKASYWFGVQKARSDFGLDGNTDGSSSYSKNDIVIAVIDTGIDYNHVDLDAGKVIGQKCYCCSLLNPQGKCVQPCCPNGETEDNNAMDDNGHGTHVSSIAAGEGQGNSLYKGVAPGSALVGIKVLDSGGSGYMSYVNAGIQWVINNKTTYGIEIFNMSLGTIGCSGGTDSTSQLVNSAVDAGLVGVIAAGNEGPAKCTIGSPAAATKVVTVGAMADVDPGAASSFDCGVAPAKGFYQVCFSSRGPTADGRLKPDISAPGYYITAARAGTTSSYIAYSGTSMSSPFTAGVAALMLDANSSLTPAQIKNTLATTARDWDGSGGGTNGVTPTADIDYGAGRIDAYEAIKSAGGFSGTNIATPLHQYFTGNLTGTGDGDWYDINVADASYPIAVTMIMPNWISSSNPDFDMKLYAADGTTQLAVSQSYTRQETIGYQPTSTGLYKLRIYSFTGSGDYFFDLSAGTAPPVSITLTTDGSVDFGILGLGAMQDTTASGLNDVQTISVDTGPANLDIKSTVFSDGTNTWSLGSTNGANQVKWESSKDTTSWNPFLVPNTLYNLANNVAQGSTQDVYFQLTMPTSTSSHNPHSAQVTIVATAP